MSDWTDGAKFMQNLPDPQNAENAESAEDEEPTSVVKMINDYKENRRKSIMRQSRRFTLTSGGVSRRESGFAPRRESALFQANAQDFNDSRRTGYQNIGMKRWSSANTRFPTSKNPRLDSSPSSSQLEEFSFLQNKSNLPRPISEAEENLQKEVNRLLKDIAEKETRILAKEVNEVKLEDALRKTEVEVREMRLKIEAEREKAKIEARNLREDLEEAQYQLKSWKNRDKNRRDVEMDNRKEASENRYQIAQENQSLLEENRHLHGQIGELKMQLEEQMMNERNNQAKVNRELAKVREELEQYKAQEALNERKSTQISALLTENESLKADLRQLQQENMTIKKDFSVNEESVIERKAMKERIVKYPQIVRDNESLKMENKLLNETMENTELLKEQIIDLKQLLERRENELSESQKSKQDLHCALKSISKWQRVCARLHSIDEIDQVGGEALMSPSVLEKKVAEFQKNELVLRQELEQAHFGLSALQKKVSSLESDKEKSLSQMETIRNENAEQTQFIKRLQRKLLLVSKERDSYKGVLDSYEHEITFSGGQFEKDRIEALEKTLQAYRETLEKAQLGVETTYDPKTIQENASLKSELESLSAKYESLQMEMERRTIRGDYDPTTTKVLHFSNNPTAQAVESREAELKRLSDENDSLKARIKLLEEGQTKDLTLLVGHKLEEGHSSQEVKELREELRLAEVRKQRLLEAFRKTSHDFREVVCQLTGYRIDADPNGQYKLTPVYGENGQDHLLFKKSPNGECLLLETRFSTQLTELIDLHLRRQHSIPVFLAAVLTDLFSKQSFDTVLNASSTTDMGQEDEPICID